MASSDDRVSRILLRFETQASSVQKARQDIDTIRQDLDNFNKGQLASAEITKKFNAELSNIGREKTISKIVTEFQTAIKTTRDWDKALEQAHKRLQQIGASESEIRSVTRSIADIEVETGGRRKTSEALSIIGREVRALPAVDLGAISTDAIAKITQLLGNLPPIAYAAAAGVGAFVAGLALVNQSAQDNTGLVREVTSRTREYYELLVSGTTESIQARIKEAELQQKIDQARVDDLSFVAQGYEEIRNRAGILSVVANPIIEIFGALGGKNFQDIRNARIEYDAATEALQKSTDAVELYKGLLDESAIAASDAAAAEKSLADARAQSAVKSINTLVNAELEAANLARTGTEEQVKNRLSALADEKAILRDVLPLLEQQRANYEENSDAYNTVNSQIQQTRDRLLQLDTTMLLLAGDTLQLAKANDAAREAEKTRMNAISAVQRYNQEITRLDDQKNQALVAAADKLNQALVDAAEQAATAAENALDKLIQRRDDLLRDAGRDANEDLIKAEINRQNLLIDAQRDEAKRLREHARNLQKIREESQRQEADLIAQRDFAGLFRLRRDTGFRLQDAQNEFSAEADDRREAIQQKLQDLARGYLQEREQNLRQLQYKFEDAQIAFEREITQIEANRVRAEAKAREANAREIQLTNQKYNAQRQLLTQGITAELQMIAQGQTGKLQLEAQYWNQAVALARGALNQITSLGGMYAVTTSSSTSPGARPPGANRATGGMLRALQSSYVNERAGQRERFNGQLLPGGIGIFTPLQSGYVNPNGGGDKPPITINMPLNFSGAHNAAQIQGIAKVVRGHVVQVLEEYFD